MNIPGQDSRPDGRARARRSDALLRPTLGCSRAYESRSPRHRIESCVLSATVIEPLPAAHPRLAVDPAATPAVGTTTTPASRWPRGKSSIGTATRVLKTLSAGGWLAWEPLGKFTTAIDLTSNLRSMRKLMIKDLRHG